MLTAVRWSAFLWGCLALGVMVYYAMRFLPDAHNVRYNEMGIGFMIGFVYGGPAWVALPVLAFAGRRTLRRWQSFALLSPVLAAVALYVAARVLADRGV